MKLWVLCVMLLGVAALQAQTVTYTEANINSRTSVSDVIPDNIRSDTGADVQRGPITGSRAAVYANGACCANAVIKNTSDVAFARASLQTGTLKTNAVLGLGPNTTVFGAGLPLGVRNGSASGSATFADSFRTFSGNKPFLWTSGATATFNFNVTGQFATSGAVADPGTASPPIPRNQVYALMFINIYKPGTIDLLRQVKDFDFVNRPFSEFLALNNQIQANLITRDYWYFGQLLADYSQTVPLSKILPIDPSTPTNVQFTFTPNGDFDWTVTLDTTVQLDGALQNVSATLDFSNSMVASYTGPPGTTVYSGSGTFPNTQPRSQAPPPNICPASQGTWKNNPLAWPVTSLPLGTQSYTQAELLAILDSPGGGDASVILATQLIAAKLNVANYSNPAPVAAAIAAADAQLGAFAGKLPYDVKPGSAAGIPMMQTKTVLENYNEKLLTPSCTQ